MILFVCYTNNVYAQNICGVGTHWTYNPNMEYNAVLTGELYLNGESMKNSPVGQYYEIGVFCGDECRGSYIPDMIPLPFYQGYAYQMMIYSDVISGEEMYFRIYDHQTETELDAVCMSPFTFTSNMTYGDLMDPYRIIINQMFEVAVVANPVNYGAVSGDGSYVYGSTCTLIAYPFENYQFVNWTENDTVLSDTDTLTMTVDENHNIVANFNVDGVDEIDDERFVIYPNPASDKVYIYSHEKIDRCEVYSFSGHLMITTFENSESFELELGSIPRGAYIIKLMSDNSTSSLLLIKD